MEHHFNVELAKRYGVNEAIFCHNIYFWVKQNKANKRNFHKGTYWTYNTMEAYTELFPYWNKKQIEHLIKKCREKGLILTDNFNKNSYDRTLWYAVTEKVIEVYEPTNIAQKGSQTLDNTHIPKMGNGHPKNGTPIPDNKPDNKNNPNKDINTNYDDDKRASSTTDAQEINLIISNLREATKDDLTDRSFKAIVHKVIDKYNQGAIGDGKFRDYLVSALSNKIEELELRRIKDKAKQEIQANKKQSIADRLNKQEIKKDLPLYNWLDE